MAKQSKPEANRRSKRSAAVGQATGKLAQTPVWPAYLSALLLWLSFAPANLGFLVWIAPVGWLYIAQRDQLTRRDYWHLWFSGCGFWLATLQGIRLAYWPLYFGWIALSLYLAVYIPLFVAVTRKLTQLRLPLWIAAPTAWVGLEMARSYLLTGFAANMLAHSQAHVPILIQIADQLGAYGISFVIMLVGVAAWQWTDVLLVRSASKSFRTALPSTSVAALLFVLNLGYGWYKLSEADRLYATEAPLARVLLVQENTPTVFDQTAESTQAAWLKYLDTTRREAAKHENIDVIAWPESTFTGGVPWVVPELPDKLPKIDDRGLDRERLEAWIGRTQQEFAFRFQQLQQASGSPAAPPHLLMGCDVLKVEADGIKRFNSALWIPPSSELTMIYDKMHLVMFGEYFPLGPLLKFLRDRFGGAEFGSAPYSFELKDCRLSPNICFESMMPRVIRAQVASLKAAGQSPDVLVNISNDSWFRGSEMLDHHLACSILCAVENRRPFLVAANTGITAEIDGAGRLLKRTDKFAATALLALPKADARWGCVQSIGYPLAWLCLAVVAFAVIFGLSEWRILARKSIELPSNEHR